MPGLAEQLTEYLNAAFGGLWVQTLEPDEAEKEIARLCQAHGWHLTCWDAARGTYEPGLTSGTNSPDPAAPVKNLKPQGDTTLLVLHNYHRFLTNPVLIQTLANAVIGGKATRCCSIVLSPVVQIPVELEKLMTVVEHPLPDREALRSLAQEVNANDPATEAVTTAAAGLTRYEAENALALSCVRRGGFDPATVWELKTQAVRKSGVLSLHRGAESFAQLGGLTALKSFCAQALRPNNPHAARGVMLLGVPGTGKSAFAKALGNETQRPVLTLDVGGLMQKYVGETEGNVRKALAVADAMSPCVLFIDEVEKALAGAGGEGDSGVSARLFGTLLTWLSDHTSNVFVVCTANDVSRLPPEFTRAERFDGVFFLDLPSPDERIEIWNQYLRAFQVGDDGLPGHGVSDVNDTDWTGAEIKSCCRLACLLNEPLEDAAKKVVPVALTARDKIEALRTWASGRCLSAGRPGVYRKDEQSPKPARRRAFKESLQ